MSIEEYSSRDLGADDGGDHDGALKVAGVDAGSLAAAARADSGDDGDDLDLDNLDLDQIAGEGDDESPEAGEGAQPAPGARQRPTQAAADADASQTQEVVEEAAGDDDWEAERERLLAHGLPTLPGATRESVYDDMRKVYGAAQQVPVLQRQIAELHAMLQNRQQPGAQQGAGGGQPAAAVEKKAPWEIPEWDPRHESFLEADPETGEIRVRPGSGGDPLLPQRYNAYVQARMAAREKFEHNPIGTLWEGGLEDRVNEVVNSRVQSILGSAQSESFARQAWGQDEQWVFERDGQGHPVVDVLGNRVPTPEGAAYTQAIATLQQRGITDPQAVREIALTMIPGMLAQRQPQGGQSRGPGLALGAPVQRPAPTAARQTAPQAQLTDQQQRDLRHAQNLKKLQRQRGTRGAQVDGGSPRNGKQPTTQGQRTMDGPHPIWEQAPDEFSVEQVIGL